MNRRDFLHCCGALGAALAGDLYMFPRSDGILLGGTHEEDVWSLEPNLPRKAELLAAHKAFFDSFRG